MNILGSYWYVIPGRKVCHVMRDYPGRPSIYHSICGHSDDYPLSKLVLAHDNTRRCEQCEIVIFKRELYPNLYSNNSHKKWREWRGFKL